MADRTEVEISRGLNSEVVRRNLADVLVQMFYWWMVDKRVWIEVVRYLGSMGAGRYLELVQMVDSQEEGTRTEVELVPGLHSKVAGEVFAAALLQMTGFLVADKKFGADVVQDQD